MDAYQLEWCLFYSLVVAGKSADFAEWVSDKMSRATGGVGLFRWAAASDDAALSAALRLCRTGNYTKIGRALRSLVNARLDLATCTPADLETIPGIGPKTSRFFILWTRPGARYAALDVHILRWMRGRGYDVPKSTPSAGPKYERIERQFLAEADRQGLTARELDWQIWQAAQR